MVPVEVPQFLIAALIITAALVVWARRSRTILGKAMAVLAVTVTVCVADGAATIPCAAYLLYVIWVPGTRTPRTLTT